MILLECPKCWFILEGDFGEDNPPGECPCHARAPWRVVKARRAPGFVIVHSHLGSQQLHGPGFRENPNGWKK